TNRQWRSRFRLMSSSPPRTLPRSGRIFHSSTVRPRQQPAALASVNAFGFSPDGSWVSAMMTPPKNLQNSGEAALEPFPHAREDTDPAMHRDVRDAAYRTPALGEETWPRRTAPRLRPRRTPPRRTRRPRPRNPPRANQRPTRRRPSSAPS